MVTPMVCYVNNDKIDLYIRSLIGHITHEQFNKFCNDICMSDLAIEKHFTIGTLTARIVEYISSLETCKQSLNLELTLRDYIWCLKIV